MAVVGKNIQSVSLLSSSAEQELHTVHTCTLASHRNRILCPV